jgi:hypothetical protein
MHMTNKMEFYTKSYHFTYLAYSLQIIYSMKAKLKNSHFFSNLKFTTWSLLTNNKRILRKIHKYSIG